MTTKKPKTKLSVQVNKAMKSEKWPDAIKLLTDQIRLVRKDWELSWNLGWCYFKLGRLNNARSHLVNAASLAPNNSICLWALGIVLLKLGRYKKAQHYLLESLKLKEDYLPRIALALTYHKQGKLAKAENVHVQGIKLRPKSVDRHEAYADFLSDVGRITDARAMYTKARKLKRKAK